MVHFLIYSQLFILCVGLFVTFMYSFRLIRWILNYVRWLVCSKKLKHFGEFVVITGCTSGIGRSIACTLIKEGVNLVLISRNEVELTKLKDYLLEKNPSYNGNIEIITFDFNTSDFLSYKKIEEKIKTLDIGVLINNVGFSYPNPLYYDEVDAEMINQLVNVNLMSSYFMTKLVLPGMKKKKKGLLVFVSSASTVIKSCPLLTVYVSVKSAINSFATSLSVELKQFNINVQCHVPFFVATKMSKIKKPNWLAPSPDTYAKYALKQMKRENGISTNVINSPYCYHKIQIFLYKLFPKCLFDSAILKLHNKFRELALRKMKKTE